MSLGKYGRDGFLKSWWNTIYITYDGAICSILISSIYSNYIYGFILMAKGNQLELYHHNKEFVQQWISAFKDSVILIDLKEDYMIGQMIGKGNFAKVHLCKRKDD